MVEVKRAVPKESSPGPNRNQISGFNYGLSRASSVFNHGLSQGYNSPSYGPRMDGRFSPVSVGRSGHPLFSPSSYNMGLNSDSVLGIKYGGNGNYSSNIGYARVSDPMYNVASNRHADPFGVGNSSVLNSTNHNMWGNGSQNFTTNNFLATRNGSGGVRAIWGNFTGGLGADSGGGGGSASFIGSNLNYVNEESTIGYKRSNANSIDQGYSYGMIDDGEVGGDGGRGGSGGSFFADPTWRASSPELEVPDLFGYSLGSGASDGIPKNSVGYVGYSVTDRSNRGIAA